MYHQADSRGADKISSRLGSNADYGMVLAFMKEIIGSPNKHGVDSAVNTEKISVYDNNDTVFL